MARGTGGDSITPEDLRQIEGLLRRFGEELRGEIGGEIREQVSKLDAKIEEQVSKLDAKIEEQVNRLDAKIEEQVSKLDAKIEDQSESFKRWFGIQREAFQHDLALVAEGHQMLAEKIDRLAEETRARADAFERELLAHRADPYAHQAWRVSEGEQD